VRMTGQTDRRTDARPLQRPCSAYYVGSANESLIDMLFRCESCRLINDAVTKLMRADMCMCNTLCNKLSIPYHDLLYVDRWHSMCCDHFACRIKHTLRTCPFYNSTVHYYYCCKKNHGITIAVNTYVIWGVCRDSRQSP